MDDLKATVEELVLRVERLEAQKSSASPQPEPIFWAVNALKDQLEEPGGIVYAGAVTVASGPVEWQITLATDDLMERDWTSNAASLAALGHPVRLSLLHAILGGATTVGELSAGEGMGTTGQLYHHLGLLIAAGWLLSGGRGSYSIPAERVVPLLVILGASRRIA